MAIKGSDVHVVATDVAISFLKGIMPFDTLDENSCAGFPVIVG